MIAIIASSTAHSATTPAVSDAATRRAMRSVVNQSTVQVAAVVVVVAVVVMDAMDAETVETASATVAAEEAAPVEEEATAPR